MHVLHVTPRFLPVGPDDVVGGSNNGLWNLAVGLRREAPGLRQSLVTLTNEAGAGWIEGYRGPAGFDEIAWRRLGHDQGPLRYGLRAARGLLGLLARELRRARPDVLHGHSGYPHYAAVVALAGQIARVPVVHSLYCALSDEVDDRRRLVAHPGLSRALLAGVDHVLPMSANVDASLARAGLPARRRTVVRPGLRPSFTARLAERAACRARFGFGDEERVVLFVGNPSQAKGFDLLLAAAGRVAPTRAGLKLACTFEFDYAARRGREDTLRRAVADSPLGGQIRFFGLVERIGELMRAADLAVFPFRNTSGPSDLPVALLECMAAGTPVLASDLAGNREVVGPSGEAGFLFAAGDEEALAVALAEALGRPPAALRAVGAAGARRLESELSLGAAAARTLEVYEDLARGRRPFVGAGR